MLRGKSPTFRVWFVVMLGICGPGIMAILNAPADTFWTWATALEVFRVALAGAWSALLALFVEMPRRQWDAGERAARLGYPEGDNDQDMGAA